MNTIEAVARILLKEPTKGAEIYKLVKEAKINHKLEDTPSFQKVPDGIYCKEVADFVGRLAMFGYADFSDETGYILTPAGHKFCGKLAAKAYLRENFGPELAQEVFGIDRGDKE